MSLHHHQKLHDKGTFMAIHLAVDRLGLLGLYLWLPRCLLPEVPPSSAQRSPDILATVVHVVVPPGPSTPGASSPRLRVGCATQMKP